MTAVMIRAVTGFGPSAPLARRAARNVASVVAISETGTLNRPTQPQATPGLRQLFRGREEGAYRQRDRASGRAPRPGSATSSTSAARPRSTRETPRTRTRRWRPARSGRSPRAATPRTPAATAAPRAAPPERSFDHGSIRVKKPIASVELWNAWEMTKDLPVFTDVTHPYIDARDARSAVPGPDRRRNP